MGTHWFSPVPNRVVLSQPKASPTAFPWLGEGELEEGWEGAGREHRPSKGEDEHGEREAKKGWEAGRCPRPWQMQ